MHVDPIIISAEPKGSVLGDAVFTIEPRQVLTIHRWFVSLSPTIMMKSPSVSLTGATGGYGMGTRA